MANFRALLIHMSNRLREKPFEKICKWFLENDPTYADTFKDIWLWYDWPDREKNGFKDETGIDLVGETHTGNLWAIQVKDYIDRQVPLNEIQDFISLSEKNEFVVRLLISLGDLSEDARMHIEKQDKSVQTLFYSDLNKSTVNWLDSLSSTTSETSNYKSDPDPIDIDYRFNEKFEAWLDWKKEHPDESVPQTTVHKGFNIGYWDRNIRAAARPGYKGTSRKPTDEQREKLNDAGFIWEERPGRVLRPWEENFEVLIAYKEKYGTTDVPANTVFKVANDTYRLGSWVSNQRSAKQRKIDPKQKNFQKFDLLTDEREKKLDSIGFNWLLKDRTIFSWEDGFDALSKYKEEFGHLYIPQKYINDQGFTLGRWIVTQKRQITIETMSEKRKDKLNWVGFHWGDVPGQRFGFLISQIKKYKEEFGTALIPFSYISDDLDPWNSEPFNKRGVKTRYQLGYKLRPLYYRTGEPFSEKQLLKLKQLGVDVDKAPPDFINKYKANVNFIRKMKDSRFINDESGSSFTHDKLFSKTTELTLQRILRMRLNSEAIVQERVNYILEDMSERDALIVKKRYGLDDLNIKTLDTIGKDFALTRERVRQLVAKATRQVVRTQILSDGFWGYLSDKWDIAEPYNMTVEELNLSAGEPYNMTVEELNLSVRTLNCFNKSGLDKVGDVLQYSEDELLKIRNFSNKSLDELHAKFCRLFGVVYKDGILSISLAKTEDVVMDDITHVWVCYCGKYDNIRFRGVVCDICGVELALIPISQSAVAKRFTV